MKRFPLAACVAAWAFSIPSFALAQRECEEGRVRVEGRCCWPGQTFSAERARCEGAPECPTALTEHGETCVARAAAGGLPPPPSVAEGTGPDGSAASDGSQRWGTAARLGIPEAYGPSTTEWPVLGEAHPWRAVRVRGEDEGLITSAFSVFEFGFVLGWLTALLDELGRNCFTSGGPFGGGRSTSCNSWPLAFIPVGGGVASGFASFGASSSGRVFGYILGIPSALLQFAGLIGMAVAFSSSTDELGFRPIGDPEGVSLSLVVGAPNADAGLSLDLRF